jgi:hypothetical protein
VAAIYSGKDLPENIARVIWEREESEAGLGLTIAGGRSGPVPDSLLESVRYQCKVTKQR